jgi:hypothetical protein
VSGVDVISEKNTVFVDISTKVETWDKDSVIALSNDHSRALLIPASVKIQAASLFPSSPPVQFRLLAIFTYMVIRSDLNHVRRIVIDRDYSGEKAERFIKAELITLIRQDYPTFKLGYIRISQIAGSRADILAREAYRGNLPIDGVITLEEIQDVLAKKN